MMSLLDPGSVSNAALLVVAALTLAFSSRSIMLVSGRLAESLRYSLVGKAGAHEGLNISSEAPHRAPHLVTAVFQGRFLFGGMSLFLLLGLDLHGVRGDGFFTPVSGLDRLAAPVYLVLLPALALFNGWPASWQRASGARLLRTGTLAAALAGACHIAGTGADPVATLFLLAWGALLFQVATLLARGIWCYGIFALIWIPGALLSWLLHTAALVVAGPILLVPKMIFTRKNSLARDLRGILAPRFCLHAIETARHPS